MSIPSISAVRRMSSTIHSLTIKYMFFKGFAYVLIGLGWIFDPSPTRVQGVSWIDVVTPRDIGILWVVFGLTAVIGSFFNDFKFRRIAWFCLISLPTLLAFYFIVSWIIFIGPWDGGAARGHITAISYSAFACSAYVMSQIWTRVVPTGGTDLEED